jgi:hypothetical protein
MNKLQEDDSVGSSTSDVSQFTPKIPLGPTDKKVTRRKKPSKIKRFKKWLNDSGEDI